MPEFRNGEFFQDLMNDSWHCKFTLYAVQCFFALQGHTIFNMPVDNRKKHKPKLLTII